MIFFACFQRFCRVFSSRELATLVRVPYVTLTNPPVTAITYSNNIIAMSPYADFDDVFLEKAFPRNFGF